MERGEVFNHRVIPAAAAAADNANEPCGGSVLISILAEAGMAPRTEERSKVTEKLEAANQFDLINLRVVSRLLGGKNAFLGRTDPEEKKRRVVTRNLG